MNNQNELIKRIDEAIANMAINSGLLRDCRAEIERLEGQNISLRYELDVLNESGAGTIQQLQARMAELEKPYVPFNTDERFDLMAKFYEDDEAKLLSVYVEAAVIKRYNEQRNVK